MCFETWCLLQAHAARLDVSALYTFLLRERLGKEHRAEIARPMASLTVGIDPEVAARFREREKKRERKERRQLLAELAGAFGEN